MPNLVALGLDCMVLNTIHNIISVISVASAPSHAFHQFLYLFLHILSKPLAIFLLNLFNTIVSAKRGMNLFQMMIIYPKRVIGRVRDQTIEPPVLMSCTWAWYLMSQMGSGSCNSCVKGPSLVTQVAGQSQASNHTTTEHSQPWLGLIPKFERCRFHPNQNIILLVLYRRK